MQAAYADTAACIAHGLQHQHSLLTGVAFLQWELINGPDLLDLLNEHGGRMTEPAAAYYFSQLLNAVLYMHSAGFCHRDIKPENCMIERSTLKLKVGQGQPAAAPSLLWLPCAMP